MDELVADLERIIGTRVLDPLEVLVVPPPAELAALRRLTAARARELAATLLGADDHAARFAAIRVVSVLWPGDAPFDPPAAWWGTPLGRAVLLRAGHPAGAEAVPFSTAAAMLGITRQGVHDLANRGKLDRHPGGGVTVASITARAQSSKGITA